MTPRRPANYPQPRAAPRWWRSQPTPTAACWPRTASSATARWAPAASTTSAVARPNEVLEFMTKTASQDIMAAHAQGYTTEQLQKDHCLPATVSEGEHHEQPTNQERTVATSGDGLGGGRHGRRPVAARRAGPTAMAPVRPAARRRIALANTGLSGKRVVVVGGGMAGMTAAKYLRLWGGSGVQVTLVEPDTLYTSSIMSNLVLNGSRNDRLAAVQARCADHAVRRDPQGRQRGGHRCRRAHRDAVGQDGAGLRPPGAGARRELRRRLRPDAGRLRHPHAARLARRRADHAAAQPGRGHAQRRHLRHDHPEGALPLPARAPTNAPAWWPTTSSGPRVRTARCWCSTKTCRSRPSGTPSKLAFTQIHAGVIQYVPGVTAHRHRRRARKAVSYVDRLGGTQAVQAQVVNPIVPHRASGSAPAAGWRRPA